MNLLTRQKLNRALVGLITISLLVAGVSIGVLDSWESNIWCGSFIRAGLLLGAFWIGMPTRGRAAAWANVSPWTTVGVIAGFIMLTRFIRRPQVLLPFVAVLFLLMFVMPLFTQRNERR